MRASLASRATGDCLRNCRPIVWSTVRLRLAHLAPSTSPCCSAWISRICKAALWLLSCLLTLGTRGSPASLTSCIQTTEQQKNLQQHGWGFRALSPAPMAVERQALSSTRSPKSPPAPHCRSTDVMLTKLHTNVHSRNNQPTR